MSSHAPIFLLTDFGTTDHYVAAMKAVILSRCPACTMVDITHDVEPQAIEQGAYMLESTWPWLPAGSVVLAVVDPGVGTDREPAVFHHDAKFIIGPNNGLLGFLPPTAPGRVLDRSECWLEKVSATFHGRDIFAPCAAYLAAGGDWLHLGNRPASPLRTGSSAAPSAAGRRAGRIIHFDHFGNAITTLRPTDIVDTNATHLEIPHLLCCPILRTYGAVEEGRPLGYIGSTGRLEIAVRGGNARHALGLHLGDTVYLAEGQL